jgi:hypothetical protein
MLDNGELDEVGPLHPAGAPIIATSARRKGQEQSGMATLLNAAMSAAANGKLAQAQPMLDLHEKVGGE